MFVDCLLVEGARRVAGKLGLLNGGGMQSLIAVVEIGSTGVRLSVAQFDKGSAFCIIDKSDNDLSMGQDVFATKSVSVQTQSKLLEILLRYKEQLGAYSINSFDTLCVATSAFREAHNRDSIQDLILTKTGFKVAILDGAEENRLMYLAVAKELKRAKVKCDDYAILEVGGGSTGIIFVKGGKVASAHSFRLGSVRLQSKLQSIYETPASYQALIDEYAFDTKSALEDVWEKSAIDSFIATGQEASLAAHFIGHPLGKSDKESGIWEIDSKAFDAFAMECASYSTAECNAKFGIEAGDSLLLQNSLLIYKTFMKLTKAKRILVPLTNIRMGVILSRTLTDSDQLKAQFSEQTTNQALSLLLKYHGDATHAQKVRAYCMKLFDEVMSEAIGDEAKAEREREKLLLAVAAILHDIGIFIKMDNHNLHSEYIIKNSEIFGLTPNEVTILSIIARCHRGAWMPQTDETFSLLSRSDRLLILRLTAILRVADALDRCHGKNFTDFSLERTSTTLVIHPKTVQALTLEAKSLEQKGDLFESTFGLHLSIL